MAIIIEFDSAAKAEYDDAIDWYARQSFKAAARFSAEVNAAILKISSDPDRFPRTFVTCQRCPLPHFPYSVIFAASPGRIRIVAIAHAKRRPSYWRRRL